MEVHEGDDDGHSSDDGDGGLGDVHVSIGIGAYILGVGASVLVGGDFSGGGRVSSCGIGGGDKKQR